MSHAFSLPFIAQVKIDCHVPERVHNCVCLCVCVCVCVRVCACACPCVHRLGTEYGMDGLCSLPLQICFLWIVFLFLLVRLEKDCPVHRHSCILCCWSPSILYQSHLQTWCVHGTGLMTLLSETVWSNKCSGISVTLQTTRCGPWLSPANLWGYK